MIPPSLPAESAVIPFTVPTPALLAIAIVLFWLVLRVMAPPSPPAPGPRVVKDELDPTPPWLVARMALPMGDQGVMGMLTPLGMAVSATLSSKVGSKVAFCSIKVAFCVIETLPPAPAL